MQRSLIYKNVHIYRLMMQGLYLGKYGQRFRQIIDLIGPSELQILELCFGDIRIANYCRSTGRHWSGVDLNPEFVRYAREQGFEAREADIASLGSFEPSDLAIIIGSLMYFHTDLGGLLRKLFAAAPRLLISEPVRNYSQVRGPVGYIARRSANAGDGEQGFRYDEESVQTALSSLQSSVGFQWSVKHTGKDLVLELLRD